MIRINLLPHREIRRAERQRQFNLLLLTTMAATVFVVFMVNTWISGNVNAQNERNQRLETENAKLDKEIAQIKDLKGQIQNVLERKQVVENLQSNRSQAVVLLDELSRQLPEGMYFRAIKQQDNTVNIEGVADSNARIATLVRSLSSSAWLESPDLVEIKAMDMNNIRQYVFVLNVKMKAPHNAALAETKS